MAFEDLYRSIKIKNLLKANTIEAETVTAGAITADSIVSDIMSGAIDTRLHSGAASILTLVTELDSTGTGNAAVTLADGVEGQLKILKMITRGGTNNSVVTPAHLSDGTTLTFDAAKEVAVLYFDGTNWQVIYTTATLA